MDAVKTSEQQPLSLGDLPPITMIRFDSVRNLHIHTGDGDMKLENNEKSITIKGNVLGNTNINNGDNANQTIAVNINSVEEAFTQLLKDIYEKIPDSQRDQLEFFVEKLKEAYAKGDKEEGQKILGFLKNALGSVASLVTIAGFFGLKL